MARRSNGGAGLRSAFGRGAFGRGGIASRGLHARGSGRVRGLLRRGRKRQLVEGERLAEPLALHHLHRAVGGYGLHRGGDGLLQIVVIRQDADAVAADLLQRAHDDRIRARRMRDIGADDGIRGHVVGRAAGQIGEGGLQVGRALHRGLRELVGGLPRAHGCGLGLDGSRRLGGGHGGIGIAGEKGHASGHIDIREPGIARSVRAVEPHDDVDRAFLERGGGIGADIDQLEGKPHLIGKRRGHIHVDADEAAGDFRGEGSIGGVDAHLERAVGGNSRRRDDGVLLLRRVGG